MFMKIYRSAQEFLFTKTIALVQFLKDRLLPFVKDRVFSFIRSWSLPLYMQLKENGQQRILFLSASLIPSLLTVTFSVMLPLINWKYPSNADSLTEAGDAKIAEKKQPLSNDHLPLLEKIRTSQTERAFWNSRLAMAKSDSVSLSVDLVDSVINLEVRGVVVRQCKIHRFKTSRALGRLPQDISINWLSKPFSLQENWATTPKIPIVVKKAPKDTLEAIRMNATPVTPKLDDVYFTLKFERNLIIEIEQVEAPSITGFFEKIFYGAFKTVAAAGSTLNDLFNLRIPRHDLLATLIITRADARAIYRALPDGAIMALRLN